MKPRERLPGTRSHRGMNVPACTPEAVITVFVDLFCTPKNSMVNPSLRVSAHGGSTSRTFIEVILQTNMNNGPQTK